MFIDIEPEGLTAVIARLYHPALLEKRLPGTRSFCAPAVPGSEWADGSSLRGTDIDFNNRFVHVQRNLSRGRISATKNGKDRRVTCPTCWPGSCRVPHARSCLLLTDLPWAALVERPRAVHHAACPYRCHVSQTPLVRLLAS